MCETMNKSATLYLAAVLSFLSSLGLGKCNDKIGLLIMISELRLYAY